MVAWETWGILLDGGGWKGSEVTVRITVTNTGDQRDYLGPYSGFPGIELRAIDSTGKIVGPNNYDKRFYVGEYYPQQSRSGSLVFNMSPYSGDTWFYLTWYYDERTYPLFDLGSPPV
jgi:hypothetical protein